MTTRVIIPRPLRSLRTPDGLIAVLGGVTYRCGGIDDKGRAHLFYDGQGLPPHRAFHRPNRDVPWAATVAAQECERIAEVGHRARFGGREWVVAPLAEDAVNLRLTLVDEPGTAVTVEFGEPAAVAEWWRDEKFRYWQWRTAGRPGIPEYPGLRLGRFATVDGLVYPVESIDPIVVLRRGGTQPHPEAVWHEASGCWRRTVPAAAVDRLADIEVFAAFQRVRGQVRAALPGGLVRFAAAGRPDLQVPVGALSDYHEVHHNLLYDLWRTEVTTPE